MREFHFIEMTKLISDWKAEKLNPRDDVLAKWLLLLGIVDKRNGKIYNDIFKELEAIAMNDETLRSAFTSWEALSGTPEEFFAYESRMKRVLDEEAAVREAELRLEEAVQKATEKATEIATKKATQRAERKAQEEKIRMVQSLLAMGVEVEKIAVATKLDQQVVLDIQEDMHCE
ncbi:PD-(D/E)XK nuclease family transposase [Sporosarcina sp. GW1-11]|uniref:PD-(D/E)XK nuclease family transposase n=1 Tax=Sporosarcina sp. GW1-11 TaxID=2899126 RepID=UPI00294E9ECD|nr:PD-(D/E)XK nuclease family transposase [Sporosarcina sp. GW1-11]MDV6379262.1 PD-(D/E)XK nuclease family transposase [Sporosarcina sp. GW1-11]